MDTHHRVTLSFVALSLLLHAPAMAQEPEVAETTSARPDPASTFSIGLGVGATQRALSIQGDSPALDGQATGPYLGATLHAGFWAPRSESGGQLGVTFEGRYGVTRGNEKLSELGREPITEHYLGTLHLAFARRLAPSTTLELRAGAQATSFLVEPNSIYTGHRYINASLGALLSQRALEDSLSLTLGAFVLPNIDTNESDGASGPSSTFGVRGQAALGYTLRTDPDKHGARRAGLELRYDFQRFRTQYPEGLRFGPLGGSSDDNQHALTLSIHYAI